MPSIKNGPCHLQFLGYAASCQTDICDPIITPRLAMMAEIMSPKIPLNRDSGPPHTSQMARLLDSLQLVQHKPPVLLVVQPGIPHDEERPQKRRRDWNHGDQVYDRRDQMPLIWGSRIGSHCFGVVYGIVRGKRASDPFAKIQKRGKTFDLRNPNEIFSVCRMGWQCLSQVPQRRLNSFVRSRKIRRLR